MLSHRIQALNTTHHNFQGIVYCSLQYQFKTGPHFTYKSTNKPHGKHSNSHPLPNFYCLLLMSIFGGVEKWSAECIMAHECA